MKRSSSLVPRTDIFFPRSPHPLSQEWAHSSSRRASVQHLFQNGANSQVPPASNSPIANTDPCGQSAKIGTIVKHGCPRSHKLRRIDLEATTWRRSLHMICRKVVSSCRIDLANSAPVQFLHLALAQGQCCRCYVHPQRTPAPIIPLLPHCKPPYSLKAELQMRRNDPRRNVGALGARGVSHSRKV